MKKINNGQLPRVKSQKAIDNNLQYIEDYRNGITKTLKCRHCFSPKPFYDFFVEWTVKAGRSTNRCKKCVSQRERSPRKPRTHKQRIRYGIVSVIRNDLSKANGKYVANTGTKEIWKALKEKCGYDEDDLMAHLESQFDENMNWDNWLHAKDVIDFGWQIHHIIPRSSLPFKTLKDENFAKCWSLNNLRTLGIKLNQVISDREVMSALNTQFRLGLINGNVTGIWEHLPYTIEECRSHLESQFDENMSWDNYGTYWHVDHIVPQAYLCFNSFRHRNFAKCWGLENLQPLSASENSSKSSRYKGIRWLYGKDVISEPEKIPDEIF